MVALGDEAEVMILDIDEERRRISLGMKQCASNPWETFAATHNKGDRVTGDMDQDWSTGRPPGLGITVDDYFTVGFEGEILWDTSKPNGQPRRALDVGRALLLYPGVEHEGLLHALGGVVVQSELVLVDLSKARAGFDTATPGDLQ